MKVSRVFLHQLALGILILCTAVGVQAQATYLGNEKFSSRIPQGWSVQPKSTTTAPTWTPDTLVSVSKKYAMHGHVPYSSGDTVELVTPFYDCSNYKYVMVKFNHICKVLPSDVCEVMYQEQGVGSYYRWKVLPKDAYLGSSATYKKNPVFSHTTYPEWGAGDTFARPDDGWWKQEVFDMSNYASFSTLRFKFIIRKGSYFGSFIASGWFVDDFQVLASNFAIRPPVVEWINQLSAVIYSTGPFVIDAKVATRTEAPIQRPVLHYSASRDNQLKEDSIRMTALQGDSIWRAVLPQFVYGTDVSYWIEGRDSVGNTARASSHFTTKRRDANDAAMYTYYAGADTMAPPATDMAVIYTSSNSSSQARVLYLASDIHPQKRGGNITSIAWFNERYNYSCRRNLKVWMLATTDSLTSATAMDPQKSGATLVFDGVTNSQLRWNNINLTQAFRLPAGKNLYVFFEGYGGNTTSDIYWACHGKIANRCAYYLKSTWMDPNLIPLMRFGFDRIGDFGSYSVALTSIDKPGKGSVAGKQSVSITLQNKGDKELVSTRIDWMVNGVMQSPKTWTGNLPCDFYDTITLGTYTQRIGRYDTLTVWVSLPNNQKDPVLSDDTLSTTSYGCDSLLKGVYTIGKGAKYDYPSLEEAMFSINTCGMGGDIELRLASGTYNEAWDFTDFGAVTGPYTVTFSSIAKNADSVKIRPSSGYPLYLDNSSHLTFQYLTFDANGARNNCVYLTNASSDITIRHCKLSGYSAANSTGTAQAVIYKPSNGTLVHRIRIIGNEVLYGSYGIYMYGNGQNAPNTDIVCDSNYFTGSYYMPVQCYYCEINFRHNDLVETTTGYTYYYGARFYYCKKSRVDGNHVRTNSLATYHYGITFSYGDSTSMVCNNEIILKNNNSGAVYGMYVPYNYGTVVANNSVFITGTTTSACYGIFTYFYGSYQGVIRNNIVTIDSVTIKGTGYPLYSSNNTNMSQFDVDYNCWYGRNYIAYVAGGISTISALQTAVPSALHDIRYNPVFKDPSSNRSELHLATADKLMCKVQPGVTTDKDGEMRIAMTVRGCYTGKVDSANGALIALLNWPETSQKGDTLRPYVVLQNAGLLPLTSATIGWRVNNVFQPNVGWTGYLKTGEMDTIALGRYVSRTGYNNITAFLRNIGTLVDKHPEDDTVNAVNYSCDQILSGNFTVGSSGYFKTMTEAIDILHKCGVGGPVTLQMQPGYFQENVVIGNIPGVNANQPLTITSTTGDSSSVYWMRDDDAYLTMASVQASPLVLDGARYIKIKNITLSGIAPNTTKGYYFSHGLVITGNTRDIEVSNCYLLSPPNFTQALTGTQHNAVFLNGGDVRDIHIHHCLVEGGANGFYLYGAGSSARMSRIRIENNTITRVDYSALYAYYTDSLTFRDNFSKQRQGNFTPSKAEILYLYYTNANIVNNIFRFDAINRGVYAYYFGDTAKGFCQLANNEFMGRITASAGCGIFCGYYSQMKIYNNSLGLESDVSDAYGLYCSTNIRFGDVKNNIFFMRSTKNNTYPVYITSTNYLNYFRFNYNCYRNEYPTQPNIGYVGAPKTSLAAWQQTVKNDTGSVTVRPDFSDLSSSLEVMDSIGISCPTLPDLRYDIRNNTRDSVSTNMGAYEFTPIALDLAVKAIVSPTLTAPTTSQTPVSIILTNVGSTTVTSANIGFSLNGTHQGTYAWKGQLAYMDTLRVTIGSTVFPSGANRLTVYCFQPNNGTDGNRVNDTAHTTIYGCDSAIYGSFTVGTSQADFTTVGDALQALQSCGMSGPVVLNILSGTYGAFSMENFDAATAKNTLTIRSATGIKSDVIFTDMYACKLTNVKNVFFQNLSFQGSVVAVELGGYLENVEFRKCNLYIPNNVDHNSYRTVNYDNTSNNNRYLNNVRFIGNDIRGGYYNFYLYYPAGATGNLASDGITIDSNNMSYSFNYGVYIYYYSRINSFSYNQIINGSNAETFYAFYSSYYSSIDRMEGNRIRLNNNDNSYGFYLANYQNHATYHTQAALLANNEIILNGNGSKYGIYLSNPNGNWDIVNNSVYAQGSGTGYCLYHDNTNSSCQINIVNNLLAGDYANVYPLYLPNTTSLSYGKCDYNNYSSTGSLAYIGGNKNSLADIRNANPTQNLHSTATPPVWKDLVMSGLQVTNSRKYPCLTDYNVLRDILGTVRYTNTAMGCYGMEPDSNDASLTAFVGLNAITSSAAAPLSVVITNVGYKPITSARIGLDIDGVNRKNVTYAPAQALASLQSDTVLLDQLSLSNGPHTFEAYVTMQNDSNQINDTLRTIHNVCTRSIAGTYRIGKSSKADYRIDQLDSLFSDMSHCGVSGDVTLAFESGSYTIGRIDLSKAATSMNGHQLTLTSLAKNRDSVLLSHDTDLLIIGDIKNVCVCDLSLRASFGNTVTITGNCENIALLRNNLTQTFSKDYNVNVIYQTKQQSINNLRVSGNNIKGGYYGLYLYGLSSTLLHKDIRIDSNSFLRQFSFASMLEFCDIRSFSDNDVRMDTVSDDWNGLYAYGCSVDRINRNTFDASKASSANVTTVSLEYINYYTNTYQSAQMTNNIIRANLLKGGTGLYVYYAHIGIYHNTVYMEGNSNGYAFYGYGVNGYETDVKGNLFVCQPTHTACYYSATNGLNMDYNNFYNQGGKNLLYYANTYYQTNQAMANATGMNPNGGDYPVVFEQAPQNLKLKEYVSLLMPNIGISEDKDGVRRSGLTTMGAYQSELYQTDAALKDFATTRLNQSQTPVSVTLMNVGTDTLTSATIYWTFNKVQQTPVQWKGKLILGASAIVPLGNVTPDFGSINRLVAWVSQPNNRTDANHRNDTISYEEYGCRGRLAAGTYTVGGNNPDYASMEEALMALNTCGISGPVVLSVRQGTYPAFRVEELVSGSSRTNTITVKAEKGATVSFDGGSTTPSLYFGSTSNWVFEGVIFGNAQNGKVGVQLEGNPENVTFRHCELLSSVTATNSGYMAICINNQNNNACPVNVRFIGNRIRGGYYNAYLYYSASTTDNMQYASVIMDSNTFSDAYAYGIYNYYYSAIKEVTNCTFTNRTNSTTFYALYSAYYTQWNKIENNRIRISGNVTGYGLYLYYYQNYNRTVYATVCNNEIHISGQSGARYGIYAYYPYGNLAVHHNTIFLESDKSTAYGLYLYNSTTTYKIDVTRNIVYTNAVTNYPLYFANTNYTGAGYGQRSYNDLYSPTNVAYAGGALANVAALQNVSKQDSHTVSRQPSFLSTGNTLEIDNYEGFLCPMLNSVKNDILGFQRTKTTLMGAYGAKMEEGVNLKAESFVSPQPIADIICYDDYTQVSVAIRSNGRTNPDFSKSPLRISLDVTGAINYHFDTTLRSGTMAALTMDTIQLCLVPTMNSGTYQFHIRLTDTSDVRADDDTLSLIYRAHRVELPYDIDFSTRPDEFVNAVLAGNGGWKIVQGKGTQPDIAPAFGTGRLEFAGANEPGAFANAIFNAVNIQNCHNPKLSFWYAHTPTDKRDLTIVLATTDGGATFTEIGRIVAADTATFWKQYDIDLSRFSKASCLSIIFQGMSFGGCNQSIDRIRITAEKDASISLLPVDRTKLSACESTPIDIKAVVTNHSKLNVDLTKDTINFQITGAINYSNFLVYDRKLSPFESDTFLIGKASFETNGAYYMEICMQPRDEDSSDDTLRDSTLIISQDVAVKEILGIDDQIAKLSGEKIAVSALVVNTGNVPLNRCYVHMLIDDEEVLTDTVYRRIGIGDTLVHPMSRPFTVPKVSKDQPYYFLELAASIDCDANEANNASSIIGNVKIPDTNDIRILSMHTTDSTVGKTKLYPTVRVANIGNSEATNITLHAMVCNQSGDVLENISGIINYIRMNDNVEYQFTMAYRVPNYTGKYTLKIYVEKYASDTMQANDTLSAQYTCINDGTGISDARHPEWAMGQNQPNPAANSTRIPYFVPQDGTVTFSLMGANGQLLRRESFFATAGEHQMEVPVDELASGIYYYSMEYLGERKVKKMQILR
ncbi:MAG: right-handed parallel beta-helix repeat-containing protein [Bacteroidales bacterium]|nr:right-handed parallel beta-helix repeat-containing protein [Bacteroidales bacterium]